MIPADPGISGLQPQGTRTAQQALDDALALLPPTVYNSSPPPPSNGIPGIPMGIGAGTGVLGAQSPLPAQAPATPPPPISPIYQTQAPPPPSAASIVSSAPSAPPPPPTPNYAALAAQNQQGAQQALSFASP